MPSDVDARIADVDIVGEPMKAVDADMVVQDVADHNRLPYGPVLPATGPGWRCPARPVPGLGQPEPWANHARSGSQRR